MEAIAREREPGLSVVIPFPDQEIDNARLIRSVIHHYFYPILRGRLAVDDPVDLERPMPADGRFDGHVVQGHVDGVGIVDIDHDVIKEGVYRLPKRGERGQRTDERGMGHWRMSRAVVSATTETPSGNGGSS